MSCLDAMLAHAGKEAQVRRRLVLLTALILAFGPVLNLAATAQDAQCPIVGTYLGFIESPDSQSVVVQYEFPIPPDAYLPMDEYPEPVSVFVATGTFTLRVGEVPEGSAIVLARDVGPMEVERTELVPGDEPELTADDMVFHQRSSYEYVNTSDEEGILLVSVPISREAFQQALEAGGGEEPLHQDICWWCQEFGTSGSATPQTSAKRIPSLQCRGG